MDRDPKGVAMTTQKEEKMKKFAVAAALLTAIVATPAMAAEGGEGRVEVRGGLITGNGIDEATIGAAAGYDFDLSSTAFIGVEGAAVVEADAVSQLKREGFTIG